MANLSDELCELSHDELQYVIDSYLLWAYNTMKQRRINIRSWKAWRRANGVLAGASGSLSDPIPRIVKVIPE